MTPTTRVLSFSTAAADRSSVSLTGNSTHYLLGPSVSMGRLWSQLRLLAPHFRVALVTGEPGSGVEAVAQALHDLSSFADTPLLKLRASEADRRLRNPSSLLDGALRGSIFVAEVDRLSPHSQQSLLRLIRLRRHRRIAIIVSSSRDLRALVSAGSFSSELASHLGSLRLALPPLRERAEDIPLLANHLLHTEAVALSLPAPELDMPFLTRATQQAWPGNIDQLRTAIVWLLQNRCQPTYTAADLDAALTEVHAEPAPAETTVRMVTLDHIVQEHVRAVLVGCNGNKLRAAEVLGISRSTLYRMLDAGAAGSTGGLALAG